VIAVLLASVGCSSQPYADETTGGYVSSNGAITVVPEGEREPAPDVSGPTLEGEEVALSDFAGQVVVLNTWGSWCAPCREEADDLATAARELRDVQFIGVNVRDSEAAARSFQVAHRVPYPSIFDPTSSQLLQFPAGLAAAAIPTTYVIDAEGNVAARILNDTTAPTLVGVIEDIQESRSGG